MRANRLGSNRKEQQNCHTKDVLNGIGNMESKGVPNSDNGDLLATNNNKGKIALFSKFLILLLLMPNHGTFILLRQVHTKGRSSERRHQRSSLSYCENFELIQTKSTKQTLSVKKFCPYDTKVTAYEAF